MLDLKKIETIKNYSERLYFIEEYNEILTKQLENNYNLTKDFLFNYNIKLIELQIINELYDNLNIYIANQNKLFLYMNSFNNKIVKIIDLIPVTSLLYKFYSKYSKNIIDTFNTRKEIPNFILKVKDIILDLKSMILPVEEDIRVTNNELFIKYFNIEFTKNSYLESLLNVFNIVNNETNLIRFSIINEKNSEFKYITNLYYQQTKFYNLVKENFKIFLRQTLGLKISTSNIESSPLLQSLDEIINTLDTKSSSYKETLSYYTYVLLSKNENIQKTFKDRLSLYNVGASSFSSLYEEYFLTILLYEFNKRYFSLNNRLVLLDIYNFYKEVMNEVINLKNNKEFNNLKNFISDGLTMVKYLDYNILPTLLINTPYNVDEIIKELEILKG